MLRTAWCLSEPWVARTRRLASMVAHPRLHWRDSQAAWHTQIRLGEWVLLWGSSKWPPSLPRLTSFGLLSSNASTSVPYATISRQSPHTHGLLETPTCCRCPPRSCLYLQNEAKLTARSPCSLLPEQSGDQQHQFRSEGV